MYNIKVSQSRTSFIEIRKHVKKKACSMKTKINRIDRADDRGQEVFESTIREVVSSISSNVQKKYEIIDLRKVPGHVNYSKVEKYLRSVNIEVTRKMFLTYLKENLLPDGHEEKNMNFSYYTREQIIYYILVDMFKPILPLAKIKILFTEILKPMIDDIGLEATYTTLYEIIHYMTKKFEEAVTLAIKEDPLKMAEITRYTNLVTLCMAKGALDFYKYSPNTLLD